jgi:hypothetical protein
VSYPNSQKRNQADPEVDIVRADDSSDITFQSTDRVLFHLHTKYLKICTKGFSLQCPGGAPEVIPLTDAASTLEVLFQFCYPGRHPELESMKFNKLMLLAAAAKKYQVFSAMDICSVRMSRSVTHLPLVCVVYAN